MRRTVVAAVIVAAFATLGGAAENAPASASRGTAVKPPTRAQLAVMVLPKQALGAAARGLEIDIGSGFTDNAAATEATLDPDDAAWQLRRRGRIVGYSLSYSDLSLARLVRGAGVLSVDTSVELFKSGREADAFIARQVRDARRLRGRVVEFGRLLASSTFPPGSIGHRNVGLRTTVAVGRPAYSTVVAVRIGVLVASATVVRADETSARTLAVRLARALVARIHLAARDELDAQPVAVPPVGRAGRRPGDAPDLAAMALTVRDLPRGATVLREGYVADRDSLGSYERELGTAPTPSQASTVESDINLLRHAEEAGGLMRAASVIYASPDIDQYLATWTDLPSVVIEQRPAVSAGDEAVALVFRFPALGAELRAVIVHVRVGRVLGTLRIVGAAPALTFADVRPLVGAFAARIRAAL